jgi:hypothetical protein
LKVLAVMSGHAQPEPSSVVCERVEVEVDAGAGFFEYGALMMSCVIGPKQ